MSTILQTEALQLFTDVEPGGQADSVMPLRWCISPQTRELLSSPAIKNPQLLIVIERDGREFQRMLVPLGDMMCFVSFNRSGLNTIRATIVWKGVDPDYWRDPEDPAKVLLARDDHGAWRTHVLRSEQPEVIRLKRELSSLVRRTRSILYIDDPFVREHEERELEALNEQIDLIERALEQAQETEEPVVSIRDFEAVRRLPEEARLDVVVPEEMFAKEPPRWMRWLGTRYRIWPRPAQDQCQLRRRALFTAGTLPFVALAAAIVTVVNLLIVGVMLLFGARRIGYEQLRHPFEESPANAWKEAKASIWTHRKVLSQSGYHYYMLRNPLFFLVNPISLAVLVFAGWLVYDYVTLEMVYWTVGAIVLLALYIFSIGSIVEEMEDEDLLAKRRQERERELAKLRARQQDEASRVLDQLACNVVNRKVSLSALPPEHRTVKLRAQAAKARVCKPFARG